MQHLLSFIIAIGLSAPAMARAEDKVLDNQVNELEMEAEVEEFSKEENLEDTRAAKEETARLKREERQLQNKISNITAANQAVKKKAMEENLKLLKVRNEAREANSELTKVSRDNKNLSYKLDQVRQKKQEARERRQSTRERLKETRTRVAQMNKEISQSNQEIAQAKKQREMLLAKIEATRTALKNAKLRAKELRQKRAAAINKNRELKSKLNKSAQELEQVRRSIRRLRNA